MKIENQKVKSGLIQITDGIIVLLHAFQEMLGVEQAPSPAEPSPAGFTPEATAPAKKGRGKAKDTAPAAEEKPATPTPEPDGEPVVPALTHEDVKQVLFKYMGLPNVGKEKGKELILGTFKVQKFNEIPVDQLPVVKATIEEAIKAAVASAEEI